MNYYQPYGGGVNSLALKLLLIEQGRDCESVFVNHGGDLPETQNHVKDMIGEGYNLTEIIPMVEGFNDIYDYYYSHRFVPLVFKFRSCTSKWKTTPQRRYYKKLGEPYTLLIGFDAGEKGRAKLKQKYVKVFYEYPLIEAGLNRRKCKELILEHGLIIPEKSDCYFCPFHDRTAWFKLARDHPDLFWKAVALEENSKGPRLRKHGGWLRDLYPPPQTFEMVDTSCNKCVFGVE